MSEMSDDEHELSKLSDAKVTETMFTALADICDRFAEEMVTVEDRFGAGEVSVKVTARWAKAPGRAHGRKFSMTYNLEPVEEDFSVDEEDFSVDE